MPHYFLHIQDGADLIEDPDGAEYVDVAAAEQEAIEGAREVMADCLRSGKPMGESREILICDHRGIVLSRFLFSNAIPADSRR